MSVEEIIKLLLGTLCSATFGLLAWNAKDLVGNVKALTAALNTNAAETKRLAEHVERIDAENTSLRKSHDSLTRWLISKGIIPPPNPSDI
ncbi:hypothetical protein [Hymenobacter metallilatus]|uniref:Uncharacterized protein n=1 Tax=Hymenobacter metallilatus TaxID=2493666 RepID=A0A428JLL2_9BACT|nr:hypothetical protein [Hymenobacter metallilatus]RSK33964.1 hypothetical protein EI290_09670 [Hymenobacter metallilatus]